MTSEAPKPPVFKEGDNVTDFLEKVREFEIQLKKTNYNLIVAFMNEWLVPYKIKLNSLLEFKNISQKKLEDNETHNKKMVKKHATKLKQKLKIQDDDDDLEDVDTDDIPDLEIIQFISSLLKKIGYSLTRRKVNEITYYSISNETKKYYK